MAFVSRQLGHASPSITLDVYSHMFDHAWHADAAREALEARFGGLLSGDATTAEVESEVVRLAG